MPGPVLMIGDSITDAARRETSDGLGTGWVRLVADELRRRGESRDIVNRGIASDRVRDLAARWDADVLAFRPSHLTVYIGINDMWRRYDSDDPTSVETFEDQYRSLLRAAVDLGTAELVLVEPFLLPHTEDQYAWFADLDPKRAAVARLADEFGACFVPLQRLMTAEATRVGAAALTGEGVHPTPVGSRLIADAWLDAAR